MFEEINTFNMNHIKQCVHLWRNHSLSMCSFMCLYIICIKLKIIPLHILVIEILTYRKLIETIFSIEFTPI